MPPHYWCCWCGPQLLPLSEVVIAVGSHLQQQLLELQLLSLQWEETLQWWRHQMALHEYFLFKKFRTFFFSHRREGERAGWRTGRLLPPWQEVAGAPDRVRCAARCPQWTWPGHCDMCRVCLKLETEVKQEKTGEMTQLTWGTVIISPIEDWLAHVIRLAVGLLKNVTHKNDNLPRDHGNKSSDCFYSLPPRSFPVHFCHTMQYLFVLFTCFLIAGAILSFLSFSMMLSAWTLRNIIFKHGSLHIKHAPTCSRLASSSVSKVTKPYPLETPALSWMIFVCFTLPKAEKSEWSSDSVVVELIPPTKTLKSFLLLLTRKLFYVLIL